MIVDYEYYVENFKGMLVPEEDFENYSQKAEVKVLSRINNNYNDFLDKVKSAICEVIDILYNQSKIKERIRSTVSGDSQVLASEKVGDYSRSYSTTSISDLEKYSSDEYINSQIEEKLFDYLFKTGLLYRGIRVV